MGRLRVKICCIASPAEARLAADAGADMAGLVGPMPSGAGVISPEACKKIARTAPAWVTPVLLTSSETVIDILSNVRFGEVKAVQLVRHVEPWVHAELKAAEPGLRIMQVIHIEGPEALDLMRSYPLSDAFLLDSGRPLTEEFGGTGRTHDWSVSAEIVKSSPVPVFLAGGLNAANVGQAIARVQPTGVDVCSGVRSEGRLDPAKLTAFMAAVADAKAAA
ncbi:MAG: hypothetical protein AB8B85_03875 [Paracoccaceae bacterium]